MKLSLLIVTSLFLFACATAPSLDEQAQAYYGSQPTDAEATVRNHMQYILKDPSSATYRFLGSVRKMWFGGGLAGPFKYGWGICSAINAKNAFGGYVGEKMYFFLIQDEKVIHLQDATYTKMCDVP